jgi:chorismate--pyruvate lyase
MRHQHGIGNKLPKDLEPWLYESGSLTKKLRSHFGGHLGVKLIYQRWKPAFINESRLLQLNPEHFQLIREVMLHVDGKPLVLARTILPKATIKIAQRNLSHLGARPLGEVIFAYPDLEKRQRQICYTQANIWSASIQSEIIKAQPVWGRRTVYAIHQQALLVAEFFLPAVYE